MQRRIFEFLFCIVFCSCLVQGCSSGGSGSAVTGITGSVVDTSGKTLSGVGVTSGTATTTTASDGSYTLTLAAGLNQAVAFSVSGHVTQALRADVYDGVASSLSTTMMPVATAQTLDNTTGGTVVGARNASITAPAGAFVDQNGAVVDGEVQVSLTPFDPCVEEQVLAYPGLLEGLTLDGETTGLISDGVLDVGVQKDGEDLQVASGKTVDLAVPAPSCGDAEATSRTWYFDPVTTQWIEVDSTSTYDVGTATYAATVNHLTSYNCDRPIDPSCVHGTVVDERGNAVTGATVTAQQAQPPNSSYYNRGIYARTYTDSGGNFCMTVEREEDVRITVTPASGQVTTRDITASGNRSNAYPADCSLSSCKPIAPIVVGTPDEGEETDANCTVSPSDNPFPYCLPLTTFYQCFHPEGACTFTLDIQSLESAFEISFANGSRIELDSQTGSMNYYGPDPFHDYCGQMASVAGATVITTATSDVIRMSTTSSGATEVECNGITYQMDAAGQSAMQSCNGEVSGGDGVLCQAAEGTFLAECTSILECDSGYECCASGRTPFGEESKKCMTSAFCDLTCVNDYQCSNGDVCCSSGYFDVCLPASYCQ